MENSVLSRQIIWRDKTFPRRDQNVVSCRANVCGATIWFGRAIGLGATKRDMRCKYFLSAVIFDILIK